MKHKILVIIALIILLVGLVSVFATQNGSWYRHSWKNGGKYIHSEGAWLEKLGLPADATEAQIMEAKKVMWGNKTYIRGKFGMHGASHKELKGTWTQEKTDWLEKAGLPPDATDEQIIEYKKQHSQYDKTAWLEKMGITEDASEEEVKEAWIKMKEENNFHYKNGFRKECSKS
jgi:1,2-phenylacetyl-CoA epoxidase catalytic subunit